MKKIHTMQDWLNSGSFKRKLTYQYYLGKYFNLFMSAYKFEGITEAQQDYILRKFWHTGNVAAFIVEGTKLGKDEVPTDVNQYPNGVIAFAPFAPSVFNIYDWAIAGNLIASRGAKFIPTKTVYVDKDVVIGYVQKNHKPVLSMVDYYLQRICDVEMTIAIQLSSHKVPWMVATTPENEEKLKKLFQRVQNDEEVFYCSAEEVEALKSLNGGNQYIIDNLFQYKQGLENELLTYLGIDNLGVTEKKEHLIGDEVNSNNAIVKDHSDSFLTCLEDFCDRIHKYLGYTEISVKATSAPIEEVEAEDEPEEKGDEEDE